MEILYSKLPKSEIETLGLHFYVPGCMFIDFYFAVISIWTIVEHYPTCLRWLDLMDQYT